MGVVTSREQVIASTVTGRLKSVPVRLLENVVKGQTVAVLQDVHLRSRLDTERAVIRHLQSELVAARERLSMEAGIRRNDHLITSRRFLVDLEQARLRILELKAILEPDRIKLRELELETRAARGLLDEGIISPLDLERTLENQNRLAGKIKENERLLAQAELVSTQSQQRSDDFLRSHPQEDTAAPDNQLDVIRKAVEVAEKRGLELETQLAGLVLSAPFDGIVIRLDLQAGEAVLRGKVIMTIMETSPREILAFQTAGTGVRTEPGTPVTLIKYTDPARIGLSRVIRQASAHLEVPERLRAIPNRAQWGRPFLVEVPPGLELEPGELVGIRP